jgi:hypothetical protein
MASVGGGFDLESVLICEWEDAFASTFGQGRQTRTVSATFSFFGIIFIMFQIAASGSLHFLHSFVIFNFLSRMLHAFSFVLLFCHD